MRKKSRTSLSILFSTTIIGAFVLFVLLKTYPISLSQTVYYCQSLFTSLSFQIPNNATLLVFTTILSIFFVTATKFFLGQYRAYRFVKKRRMTQSTKFTKLNIIIKKYAIEEPIVVYNCQKLSAFCHGLRNPKIYISSTVLQEMNVEEIASIILHEQYHIKKNDNKKFFVVFMLQSVFFPFPFLKDLVRRYRLEKEIAADQSAIQQLGKNEPLITAFKKMLTFTNRNQTHTLAFTPSFADFETLEARIKVLTNQAPPVLRLLGMKRVMISVCSLTILFAFSLVPVHAADHQPRDYHSAIVCLSEESCSMTCEDSLREVSSENNYSSQPYSPAK